MSTMTRKGIKTLTLLVASIAMTACGKGVYYDQSLAVDEHGWQQTDSLDFEVEVDDTMQLYDFLVEVRNNVQYPYSNIFLFINTTFPDGSIARDTLECPLADDMGQWYGKRAGRYVDSRYRIRQGKMRFPMLGTYRFSISNGMRDSAVNGVKDIGLRIEYSNKN